MIEATLGVNGVEVTAVPGQVGRSVNIPDTLIALESQMRTLTDGLVPLVIEETPPEILDASQQAEIARQILSAPLTLQIPGASQGDPGPYVIPPAQLAGMLAIQRTQTPEGVRFQVGLADDALYTYLSALAPDIDRQPANARFMFNDDTRLLEVIQPAVIGRSLDVYATMQEINQKVLEGQHAVTLKLITNQPEIGDSATGDQLGIHELLVAYTSYFRGSSTERLQNIQKAAANFHGLLVPPGATFSMASVMGDVSLDTGYAEAWIIFGGRTIKGVGGGVCQVSTTLFRTAFLAGFPIVERHPHAYRVGYYEQTSNDHDPNWAGLDATVFVPMVDFKFTNDTPYWLLMETYFNEARRSLTWKFYSTSDGRSVEWDTSGPQNIVDPPDPVYEENPDLAPDEIKQVDWAAEGADVTVTRLVSRDGQILYNDTFITHYLPWGDVFQYGPGTKLPKKFRIPPNP
jgi:vancomycin resistance protein YoaR